MAIGSGSTGGNAPRLERRRPLLERTLDRHSLDARAELDAMATCVVEHVLRIARTDDRGAVGKQDHVRRDPLRDRKMAFAARGSVVERGSAGIAGGAAAGDAGVEYVDVGRR